MVDFRLNVQFGNCKLFFKTRLSKYLARIGTQNPAEAAVRIAALIRLNEDDHVF